MIAIIPTRFTSNISPASPWSEHMFRNWMLTAIPFSLGNFWWSSAGPALISITSCFPSSPSKIPAPPPPTRQRRAVSYATDASPLLRRFSEANGYADYSAVIR